MFQPFNGGGTCNTKIYGVFKHFILGDAPADPNMIFFNNPMHIFQFISYVGVYCPCDNPRLYHTGRPKYFIKHLIPELLLIQSFTSTLQWPCYLDLSIQSFAFVNDKYISWKQNVVWGKIESVKYNSTMDIKIMFAEGDIPNRLNHFCIGTLKTYRT